MCIAIRNAIFITHPARKCGPQPHPLYFVGVATVYHVTSKFSTFTGSRNQLAAWQLALVYIMSRQNLPKVADAEKESLYGYVFGVSGPGEELH